MNLVLFLIVFPLLAALVLLVAPAMVRSPLVKMAALVTGAASAALLHNPDLREGVLYALPAAGTESIVFALEMAVSALLAVACLRYRKPMALIPLALQTALVIWSEHAGHGEPGGHPLYVDSLSVIMALIIGIIGGLIAVHALGYMADYHAHHEGRKDDRRGFFVVFFLFLSAMFGLVFANSLTWLFVFWEITTLCSFLLIAYPRTDEAIGNAFLALTLNLVGGVGFAGAIAWQIHRGGSLEVSELIAAGSAVALLPALLVCFAGVAKAAQFPFSSWLLGAMVAPTPVSALLHSSTMVKAGVYVIIRLSPILHGTLAGNVLALVGGVTFLLTSLIAITQSNAKRVLAYSTIANLGLIIACAATGHPQAVWAAILLVIFHAVAKALLFLTVGTVEHQIGSRDIEDMQGLMARAPGLALAMLIGIAGMFLAPFGMLISKWAALEALVQVNPLLALIICFGSAATLFFWAKWMGQLLSVDAEAERRTETIHGEERFALRWLSYFTAMVCGLFPVISTQLISPYLVRTFGHDAAIDHNTLIVMGLMLGLIAVLPMSLFYRGGHRMRKVTPFLSGANVADRTQFTGSMGLTRTTGLRNYYLAQMFGERKITWLGIGATLVLLVGMFAMGVR